MSAIDFQGSSATCPVCRKNARIRQLLCFPLTSPEHILQAFTQQTSASTIQLLRSMLDPNYESQHNLRTSEDQSHNRQLYADQENNRLSGILLHPNFLEYSLSAMMSSHNNVHTDISETISSITEHLSDPTLEDYHENIRTILDLTNETQEIIHQSALVSIEIIFIEEYQALLYQAAPETQLPFLPPSTHNHHINPPHSPVRCPFRQRTARSAPSEQQLPNTSGLRTFLQE